VTDSDFALTETGLRRARELVAQYVPQTPARRWPLLEQHTGTTTWVKHENHNPTGAFKVRGGLNFMSRLTASGSRPQGVISASRGNHSQSLAFAGAVFGVPVTIVVPEGNSEDKNAATLAYGAELIIAGNDFQEAVEHAREVAADQDLLMVPSFHPWLIEGVAGYAAELHEQVPDLDVVYVPIGLGSGICANIAVRDLIGATTEIVGVVADQAPAYALSYESGEAIATDRAQTFVDGVACRVPDPQAVKIICAGASRVLRISEQEAAEAMALTYRATHNLAEPAGALAVAGLLSERDRVAGRQVAVVQTGGNADFDVLARVLAH
jgi:threonine dehydratase